MTPSKYQVNAIHCDHRAGDDEVYAALQQVAAPLQRSWEKLKAARRIWIKFNQDWPRPPRLFEGQHQELVSERVTRATLRLLRENTHAELIAVDVSFFQAYENARSDGSSWLANVLREFDASYLDCNQPPKARTPVPGGGLMFDYYFLPQSLSEVDAVVSVQKMKNHAFMGVTLCLKNLFGLLPTAAENVADPLRRHRHYYHHLVRMPYMLVDIGRIFNPTLNIIDGLVAQADREWDGEGRVADALIAGDHPIATDACGTYLMGHDPQADWLTPPFHRDRNPLKVGAESGWGSVNLQDIDFTSNLQPPLAEFHAQITDPLDRVISWRRTTAEQALYYRDHRQQFLDQYARQYILLQQNEVRWHDPVGHLPGSRRKLAGDNPDEAMWLKYVDPDEDEGEHFEVYERTLQEISNLHNS